MQGGEFIFRNIIASRQFAKGHRIGQVRGPVGLIEIEPDAHDAFPDAGAFQRVFDEDAADFPLVDPDVVGPLDAGLDSALQQVTAQGERGYLRDQDGITCIQDAGAVVAVQNAERQILPGGAVPGVGALSAPRRLAPGSDG